MKDAVTQAPPTVAVQLRKMPYHLHMRLKVLATEAGTTLEQYCIDALSEHCAARTPSWTR